MLRIQRNRLLLYAFAMLCLVSPLGEILGNGVDKREEELRKIAFDIRKAILQHDVRAILNYVDAEGVMCTDDLVPYKKIEHDLNDPTSYLYMYLFDPARYKEKYGEQDAIRPTALKEFFEKATDLKVKVTFKSRKFGRNWAAIQYISSISQAGRLGSRRLDFKFSNNRWTIDTGLYDCGGY